MLVLYYTYSLFYIHTYNHVEHNVRSDTCVAANDVTYPIRICWRSITFKLFFGGGAVSSPPVGQKLLIHEVSRSHSDTPQSIGLLWTSDQLVAETSTCQHTTLTTDRHPYSDGIRTHNVRRRAAADLRLRPRDHWDRQNLCIYFIFSFMLFMSSSTLCYWFHRNRKTSESI